MRSVITTRSRPYCLPRTSSPARSTGAGLTRAPWTLMRLAWQALEAAVRALAGRTDQIQMSTRPA